MCWNVVSENVHKIVFGRNCFFVIQYSLYFGAVTDAASLFFLLLSAWDLCCKAKLFVRSPIHFIRLQFARHHIKGIYAFKAFKVLIQTNVSVVALPQNNDGNAYCFRIPTTMMTFENIFRYLYIWKWWLYLALTFDSDISFFKFTSAFALTIAYFCKCHSNIFTRYK